MRRFEVFILALLMLAPLPVSAHDYVWLIGGGYSPDSSQAQIEQNVLWVSQLLKTLPDTRTQRIYFDDGDNPASDVREQVPLRAATLEPLRRLFAHGHVAGYFYRNHAIPRLDGGTERAVLVANLEQEIARLRPGDRLLIVFNGHGSRNRRDPTGNRLWLWNDTSLDVREFDALLAHVPPVVPVRLRVWHRGRTAIAAVSSPNPKPARRKAAPRAWTPATIATIRPIFSRHCRGAPAWANRCRSTRMPTATDRYHYMRRTFMRCVWARAPICRVRRARRFWNVGSRGTPIGVACSVFAAMRRRTMSTCIWRGSWG